MEKKLHRNHAAKMIGKMSGKESSNVWKIPMWRRNQKQDEKISLSEKIQITR